MLCDALAQLVAEISAFYASSQTSFFAPAGLDKQLWLVAHVMDEGAGRLLAHNSSG